MAGPYFPLSLDLSGRPCVVIGGGHEALKKSRSLLAAHAQLHLISPDLLPELALIVASGRASWQPRTYQPGDLNGYFLAFACTDDEAVNAAAVREAKGVGVLLNVVDQPDRCDFIMPAVVRQGSLTFAVTTDGKSPALAKRVQGELAAAYGPAHAEFLDLLGRLRPLVRGSGLPLSLRSELYGRIVGSGALERLQAGDRAGMYRLIIQTGKEYGLPWETEWSTWLEPAPAIPT